MLTADVPQPVVGEAKTSVFAGLGALFSNFFVDFLAFFLNVPAPPEGRAREAREANTRC